MVMCDVTRRLHHKSQSQINKMPDTHLEIRVPLSDLPPGKTMRVELAGEPVCLANVDGEIFAVSDTCTHAGVPLNDGPLEGRVIVCPWHGAMFDLKTGAALCGPACEPLRTFAARIENDTIVVQPKD